MSGQCGGRERSHFEVSKVTEFGNEEDIPDPQREEKTCGFDCPFTYSDDKHTGALPQQWSGKNFSLHSSYGRVAVVRRRERGDNGGSNPTDRPTVPRV